MRCELQFAEREATGYYRVFFRSLLENKAVGKNGKPWRQPIGRVTTNRGDEMERTCIAGPGIKSFVPAK